MERLQVLVGFCILIGAAVAYNLDSQHPIVYETPDIHGEGGYFGMSVAIRPRAASLENSWAIQIGAPRGNAEGTNVREPGTVYRCHMYGPCREFKVDSASSEYGGNGAYAYREKKDGAWIGVSMDIRAFPNCERSVICGHRWINQNLKNPENIDVTYLMTGACYLQDLNDTSATSVQKLLPLVNKDKIYTPNPYVVDLSTYHWGLGQAGFAVLLTAEPQSVIIGAPGVTHWVGSVIRYGPSFEKLVGNFARTDISKKSRYTYLGYSVAAGRFYKDRKLWFVAGAPRSGNYRGEVFTFQYKNSTDSIHIQSYLIGETFGEYFGSSLAVCDVNGDAFDDLVVGAPLYSNRDPDEGRIYLYLGTSQGNFMMAGQVINGQASHGRFGSCTASLGDLDQDGRGDVAVGAPYEDGQRGVVYIFRGLPTGLETEYAQRICAEEIYPHLRGFGVSISSPVDIDGNKYRDVAIGAYLSGHVVLLRSRPVVFLHPKIKTEDIFVIDRKDSYVNITVCSRYSGSNAPIHLDILSVTEIDPLYGRGSLDASNSPFQKKLLRVRLNEIVCETHPVVLNLSGKNYSPLQITVRNEIPPCSATRGSLLLVGSHERKAPEADGFSKWCPVGNTAEALREIPFAGVCGTDNLCLSDLDLVCIVPEFRTKTYVLGSSELLVLSLEVRNLGEPAYNTKIKIWSSIKLNEYDHEYKDWSEPPRKTFWLLADGALADTYRRNFSFRIPMDSVREMKVESDFLLMVDVFTTSSEVDLTNNNCRFSVQLVSETFINFYSSSSMISSLISRKILQQETIKVTHYYEVQKTGLTHVREAELMIYIPYHYENDLLTFEVETSEGMQYLAQYEEPQVGEKRNFQLMAEPEAADAGTKGPPTNRTLFLNCSGTETKCHVLRIFFTHGIPRGLSSYVKILISLNISAIDSIKGEEDIIYVSTTGTLRFSKFLEEEAREVRRSASIVLYREEGKRGVDAWVVALSILAGAFLLSLLVTGLVKSNFFKRSKKQELKVLKEADASFIYFATGPDVNAKE